MTEHDVLVAAKGYLLNHGWMQGSYGFSPAGPRCLVGAIMECASGSAVVHGVERVLNTVEEDVRWGVPVWNDCTARTFDDVIALLDKAILATAPQTADEPEVAVA
jgi:hypothetical protein